MVLRQNVGAEIRDFVHRLGRFAYGESSHGKSVGAKFRDALDGLLSQVLVHAALDNPEELLVITVDGRVLLQPLHGFGRPFERVVQAMLRLFRRTREGRAFVERHDDVGADFPLGVHDACRAKEMLRTVQDAAEFYAFGRNLAQVLQAPYLESAAIREYRAVPRHELVDTARLRNTRGGGAQVQVVRIRENDFGLDILELCGRHCLDGRFGAHRHKDGCRHVAVVGMDYAQTGFGLLGCLQELETVHIAKDRNSGQKENPAFQPGFFCGRTDLNCHGIAPTSTSS